MNTTHYRLISRWRTFAPIEPVWELILHSEDWPRWWNGVKSVREIDPGRGGIGNVRRYVWRSAVGYKLCFDVEVTRVEPLQLLEGAAHGEVSGWGRWHFRSLTTATEIVYEWDVQVQDRGLRWLSPIGRPLFEWNHHRLMRAGAEGLARELGREVVCEAIPARLH